MNGIPMLRQIFISVLLMLACLAIQIVAFVWLVQRIIKVQAWTRGPSHPFRIVRLLTPIFLVLMLAHVAQVSVWAAFYHLSGSFETAESAAYFSIVSTRRSVTATSFFRTDGGSWAGWRP